MGPGQGSVQSSLVWVWKIPPKNPKNFNFFLFGSKKSLWVWSKSARIKDGSASYLLQVKSMLGLGQGPPLIHSHVYNGLNRSPRDLGCFHGLGNLFFYLFIQKGSFTLHGNYNEFTYNYDFYFTNGSIKSSDN